jgi:hypothetical protein
MCTFKSFCPLLISAYNSQPNVPVIGGKCFLEHRPLNFKFIETTLGNDCVEKKVLEQNYPLLKG